MIEVYNNYDVDDLTIYESNKVMKEISEEIFHDFKNILATISGLAQLSMIKTQSDEVRNYLTHINQATFDFRDTLEKFYLYTNGEDSSVSKPHALKDIVNKALDMVEYRLNRPQKNKKEIKLDLLINSDAVVNCNEYDLKQSLINIMMNSIDAMEDRGGSLTVELTDNADGSYVNVNITDSGIGISEEDLQRVFESKFTTKEFGSGLGLKIAKNCIERLGGSINLTSKLNHGTRVEMRIPTFR